MTDEERWNSYFYDGEEVLKNKLNIHDCIELKKKEYEIVAKKNVLLYLSQYNGDFDINYLRYIHKYLFEDIYYFAGNFRDVNIGKGDRASFTDYHEIEANLKEILNDLDNKLINYSYSKFLYAEALANIYYLLLEIHPFREGNGRTIREFLREYVKEKNILNEYYNYELDFILSKDEKELLDKATKGVTRGELVLFFNKMLKCKVKDNKKAIKNVMNKN